ncbi:hypothetical protein HanHA300_Chr08g0268131 [Helianthus annuus]|nr:hypothetical protein HanHA300_Chr08g0268131 [Helianthus annuus]KAJ0552410.1 hypothetical protein HanHA89_Chr08g0284961 [Helianthus annuus]KAJ0718110.1 hypothetical protein HanLR1_Chr08g0267021 [Helianthus annuus]
MEVYSLNFQGENTWIARLAISTTAKYRSFLFMRLISVHEIYYHFQIHGQDLDADLTPLGNDGDVLCLAKYVAGNKVIRKYIEHGFTRIADYLTPPKATSVVIEELEDAGPIIVNANILEGSCR